MSQIDYSAYEFSQIPFDEIVRLGQRTLLYNDLFCVSWILGRYCNYRCSYCWPHASTRVRDHQPGDLIRSSIDEIKRQAMERGLRSFHFSFSGGEPSLHPEFLEIVSHYAKPTPGVRYLSLHMTTNLSQPKAWYSQYAEATQGLHRASLTASFHREFAKRESFAEKLKLLQSAEVHVTINMVLSPDRFDDSWGDAVYFHENGINVTLKPQSDETASSIVPGYTDRQLRLLREGLPQREYTAKRLHEIGKSSRRPQVELADRQGKWQDPGQAEVPQFMQVELHDSRGKIWYMDQAERFNSFNFNQFQGWECGAGYRSLIVWQPGGIVKRGYSCGEKHLGTLETGFQLFDEPKPCSVKSCVSSADSKIPKRRPPCDLPLWPEDVKAHQNR